jgi:hypothetical protein
MSTAETRAKYYETPNLIKALREEADRLTKSTGTLFMSNKEVKHRQRIIMLLDIAVLQLNEYHQEAWDDR